MGKRLITIVGLLILGLNLSGCSFLDNTPLQGAGNRIDAVISNPFNDPAKEYPENSLKEFLACLRSQDYSGAAGYVSEQVKESLNEKFLQQMAVGEGFNLTKVKPAVGKNKKPDPQKMHIYYSYDKEPEGSLGQEAVMVKEGGSWKVLNFGEFSDY